MTDYPAGQCTWYAAHYWKDTYENESLFFVRDSARHASTWPSRAEKAGLSLSLTPVPGAVACWPKLGAFGHVAIVSAVNSDGTIDVQEHNINLDLQYGERRHVKGADVYILPPDANPEFTQAWQEMVEKGIYTSYTKPNGIPVSKEELAVFNSRILKHVASLPIQPSQIPYPPSPPQV